jgi:psp operon transcriptional activator
MAGVGSGKRAEALGQSEVFLDFQEQLSRVAPVERPVLLLGERGTGKELAAGRLHFLSKRWDGPFITLNCSTLSPTLIESELFGYEKGAFTGADTRHIGRFEAAHGGTLFLDEVGTIPMVAQEKILRVVEYGSFERVGSSSPIEVDVRIVCATNADLVAMAEEGEFKRDLLDRLSFEVLYLPPLRYRGEDILLLANHFGTRMAYELGIDAPVHFSSRAISLLQNHTWEGNIRELKNVVERAVYKSDSPEIDHIEFDPFVSPFKGSELKNGVQGDSVVENIIEQAVVEEISIKPGPLKPALRKLEEAYLHRALTAAQFNQKKAAKMLDLTYDQFRGILKKHKDSVLR